MLHQKLKSTQFTDDDVATIANLVERYDTIDQALQLAEQHTDKALTKIAQLPAGAARDDLERLARHLLMRDA